MNWIEEFTNRLSFKYTIENIKEHFKNKEIHEIIDNYIIKISKNKDMYIDSANFYGFTIKSIYDDTTISLEIHRFTNLSIFLYLPSNNSKNIEEYTINYKVEIDENEGKITITDIETNITKDKSQRVIKIESGSLIRTYVDNNLRYLLENGSTTNLLNSCSNSNYTKETYIDLDRRAVCREITCNTSLDGNNSLTIKYLETDQYSAAPFEDLYELNNSEASTKMEESTEEIFNEFVNGGNNRVLYK